MAARRSADSTRHPRSGLHADETASAKARNQRAAKVLADALQVSVSAEGEEEALDALARLLVDLLEQVDGQGGASAPR